MWRGRCVRGGGLTGKLKKYVQEEWNRRAPVELCFSVCYQWLTFSEIHFNYYIFKLLNDEQKRTSKCPIMPVEELCKCNACCNAHFQLCIKFLTYIIISLNLYWALLQFLSFFLIGCLSQTAGFHTGVSVLTDRAAPLRCPYQGFRRITKPFKTRTRKNIGFRSVY